MRFRASRLIGRHAEMEVLQQGLDRAAGGHGGAVALVAHAGLGKSRVLREFLAFLPGDVARATGRASAELLVPFRPLTEALLAVDRDHRLAQQPAITDLLPMLGPVLRSWPASAAVDPAAEVSVPIVAEAILRCLTALPGSAFVLGLEDLHWADAETLAAVEYIADNAGGTKLLLVATMRPDPASGSELFRRLEARAAATVRGLEPITSDEVQQLVRDCLDGSQLDVLERFIHDRSEGNPLLVEELLAGLHSSGALVRHTSGWTVRSRITPQVPLTLVETVRQRLAALDDDTRATINAAAVLGRTFDWRHVADMAMIGVDRTLASLHHAAQAQLIDVVDGAHQFRHALTRDAVFETLTRPERELLAVRALDIAGLQADHASMAALAELANDCDRAVEHLRGAATDHLAHGAIESAVQLLERAVDLSGDPSRRIDVQRELASALVLAGRARQARAILDDALLAVDAAGLASPATAELHLVGTRIALTSGDRRRALDHLALVAAIDPLPEGLRAECDALRAHVSLNLGRTAEAINHAEAAVAAATRCGRLEVACEALEVIGRHLRFEDPSASTASLQRAVALAEQAGLTVWHLRARHELAVNEAFLSWRHDELEQVRRQAQGQGALLTLAVVDLHEAGTLLIGGELDRGLDSALRCVDSCRRYRLSMLPIALVHLAAAHALRGDITEMREAVREAHELAPDDLDVAAQAHAWVDGNLALHKGDLDVWRHHLEDAMAIVDGERTTIPSPWRGQYALAAVIGGDPHPATQLRDSHAAAVTLNLAHLLLGDAVTAGRADDARGAETAFERADRLLAGERCGLPRSLARLLVAPCAASDGWGEPEAWLREALTWFGENRYEGLEAATRRTMRDVGMPVPRRGRGDSVVPPDLRALGVTSREMDVLILVGQRLTNREIADRLHLSVRTVEKYVASMLTKTGARDRRELATSTQAASLSARGKDPIESLP